MESKKNVIENFGNAFEAIGQSAGSKIKGAGDSLLKHGKMMSGELHGMGMVVAFPEFVLGGAMYLLGNFTKFSFRTTGYVFQKTGGLLHKTEKETLSAPKDEKALNEVNIAREPSKESQVKKMSSLKEQLDNASFVDVSEKEVVLPPKIPSCERTSPSKMDDIKGTTQQINVAELSVLNHNSGR